MLNDMEEKEILEEYLKGIWHELMKSKKLIIISILAILIAIITALIAIAAVYSFVIIYYTG